MSDEPITLAAAKPSSCAPRIDIELVDSLPGGRLVLPVESEGRFVWLVVRGHLSEHARREMEADINRIIEAGLWTQNWDGADGS